MNKSKTPNFLCVGAQKAGTTSLHDILKQHPQVYLPERKEAHFFDNEDRYKKGLDWWMNEFFSTYNDEPIIGAMTPEYLYYPEVPSRIAEHLTEDLKLIIVLRHPVDRAYSHYLMSKRRGFEELSFEEAIEAEPKRILQGDFERNHFSYLDRGRYVSQVKRYLNLFPAENILILSFEQNIKQGLDDTLKIIQSFLGVKYVKLNTSIKSNVASETKSKKVQQLVNKNNLLKRMIKPLIPQKTRRAMKQKVGQINSQEIGLQARLDAVKRDELFEHYYANEIETLTELTNIDFSFWKGGKQTT